MKITLFLMAFLAISLTSYNQKRYALGENEFTENKERATTFTRFNPRDYTNVPDSIDLSTMMPPAGDQGTKGACWAWATTYVMRSFMDRNGSFFNGGNVDYAKVYSPEFVYQLYKGDKSDCNWGATSSDILDKILHDGVVKYKDFPYNQNTCNSFSEITRTMRATAKTFARKDYSAFVVEDLFSIKKVLSEGQPLVISIRVDDYFCTKGNITKANPKWVGEFGTRAGSHAMVVVGYNNRLGMMKVLNSWGTDFGENGYVWISYGIISSAMNYCCYPKKSLQILTVTSSATQQPEEEDEKSVRQNLIAPGIKSSLTAWFKQGYYVPFIGLKIVLATLNPARQFAVVEIRDDSYNLLTNFYIDVKSSKSCFIGGKKYTFTLDDIGNAGSNFLKKAAFFTISQQPATAQLK